MEKIYAIGDIHGCLDKLEELMDEIRPNAENDTLVFLGDYIDRGPDSRGVVDFTLELRETYRMVCLRGNHEEMFLDYVLRHENRDLYLSNGGRYTLRSYGLGTDQPVSEEDFPEEHMQFFKSLLYYYETENYIFVHAGLRPGQPLDRQHLKDLVWIREEFIFGPCESGKTVIFGHTPFHRPFIDACKIGIDTGAVFHGTLTCLELPERKFHQV
jgi:serine/threonine protein phosphatase 1